MEMYKEEGKKILNNTVGWAATFKRALASHPDLIVLGQSKPFIRNTGIDFNQIPYSKDKRGIVKHSRHYYKHNQNHTD